MSNIFWRSEMKDRVVFQGWCYKYKNKVSKLYNTKQDAETALIIRMMESKPQRGRSTIKTV